MARVIALVDDIFFQAKMLETAKHVGVELECVATGEALAERAGQESASLVVIDLNARCGGIEALERLAAGNHPPVIGFLSHVQAELAERAKRAGCSDVMPRSRFTQDLAKIFLQVREQAAQGLAAEKKPAGEN